MKDIFEFDELVQRGARFLRPRTDAIDEFLSYLSPHRKVQDWAMMALTARQLSDESQLVSMALARYMNEDGIAEADMQQIDDECRRLLTDKRFHDLLERSEL